MPLWLIAGVAIALLAPVASATAGQRGSGTAAADDTAGEPAATATRYEAESAVCQGTVDSDHAGFSGTGFCNTTNTVGAYLEWTVNAATAGTHTLRFRYANGTSSSRPMDVAVNGALAVDELSFAGTGAWSTWQTRSATVSLRAGANTVRATATTSNGGPNVDYLDVESSAFQHPGVLVSRAQLDRARQQALAGAQPWKSAYDAMRASNYASLSWTPKPREVVECGPSSNPNYVCSDERNDALAAYTHGLLWYVTRDSRHAQKSIQIMDAWSGTIRDHTNHNAPLQTGWAGSSFARAGELIRHTYSSWPNAGRFATMLREVYLPEVINGKGCFNGNWELIMMDASIGIAVFLDDRASFDKAVRIWRGRVPAYVYQTSDGSIPKAPPNCPSKDTRAEIIAYWHGQETFVDGLAQETCRDFGHTGWGLAAAVNVAETAWHQGINLYGEMSQRLSDGVYFHARYELNSAPSWLCGGSVKRGFGSVTEVAYNHFHNRLGYDMPTTQRYTESKRPANANYFRAWETLTHADNP
ncbi:MAG: alginate lyase family protein [Micromonosporaceae bacterium]